MAIEGQITVRRVATKSLPTEEKDAFVARFTRWVTEEHAGNQTHAGKALGITQSHVSALMNGDRGPGLSLLLILRKKTGISLDEWLGLRPLPPPEDDVDASILHHLEALNRAVDAAKAKAPAAPVPSPAPQPRRRA